MPLFSNATTFVINKICFALPISLLLFSSRPALLSSTSLLCVYTDHCVAQKMSQKDVLQIDYLIYPRNSHSATKRAFPYLWYALNQITGNPFVATKQCCSFKSHKIAFVAQRAGKRPKSSVYSCYNRLRQYLPF